MDEVISRVMNKGGLPDRQDIADLLASIGKPGEKREEKRRAVLELIDETGHNGLNGVSGQQFHVADNLHTWQEY